MKFFGKGITVAKNPHRGALRIAAVYTVAGALWILLSDRALTLMFGADMDAFAALQTYKGTAYIVVTAVLIYWLVRRGLTAEQDARNRLRDREQDVREKLRELDQIYQHSPIGLGVLDRDLRYCRVNEVLAELNGRPAADHVGRTVDEVLPRMAGALGETLKPVLEEGKNLTNIEVTDVKRADEATNYTYLCSYTPLTDDNGEVTGVLGSVLDITERKRAESVLRMNDTILQNLPDAVIVTDPDGAIRHWHGRAESIFGYQAEEVIGCRSGFLFHPNNDTRTRKRFTDTLERTGYAVAELLGKRKDGTAIPIQVTTQYVYDAAGTPAYIVGITKDLTDLRQSEQERRQLEAQVQQAQKMESLGLLAGGIAHDFNNLLLGVLGNADLALMDISESSPSRGHIESIVESAQRAAELCNQLLAYSGKGRFVIRHVNLSELVREMSHLLEVSIAKSTVLKMNCAEELPQVEADVTQMRQVIMNLITNASDALRDKSGIITIRTGAMECDDQYLESAYIRDDLPEGRYVYLEVADTGVGMDRQTQARIFDPFFTTKEYGHGLGLAAVLGIVRGHSGTVKIYSESGRGTTIKVLLPASEETGTGEEPAAAAEHVPHGHGAILVADDEPAVRRLTEKILAREGFDVLLAEDGQHALELFDIHADSLALVLLDMTMPRLSGEETFREIRKRRRDIPVILSSGYNEQEATNQFTGKGLAGFVQKPYRAQYLVEVVYAALGDSNEPGDKDGPT